MTYDEQYAALKARAEEALATAVPQDVPEPLYGAMRYSLLAPGKRLRPVLLLAAHRMLSEDITGALPFAAAIEMIHTYSLIHDDLPAMDNDTLRRGRPTSHVVYGEAVAILAGDGLLNLAFETMLESGHPRALSALKLIAANAGVTGMIAGQTLDVTREGETPTIALVSVIHQKKTACLIKASVASGLALAGAGAEQLKAGELFGEKLGLAFQIIDDLLDLTGDEKTLGKHPGKDESAGKLTWPSLFGADKAKKDAENLIGEACGALKPFGNAAEFLRGLAQSTLSRVQ